MKLRSRWLIRGAAFGGAQLLRVWLRTLRARAMSVDSRVHPADPRVERFIYAFWHEAFLAPAKIKADVRVLISQSVDGELIAQVCGHLGIDVVRGSSRRGGAKALLDMLRDERPSHLVITPDGPRGPRRQVQMGVVFLASHTGLPIVPIGVGYTRAWRAGSWDRFAVPLPFSTVTGVVGQPIAVPSDIAGGDLEDYRHQVESAMLAATADAEQWAQRLAAGEREPCVVPERSRDTRRPHALPGQHQHAL